MGLKEEIAAFGREATAKGLVYNTYPGGKAPVFVLLASMETFYVKPPRVREFVELAKAHYQRNVNGAGYNPYIALTELVASMDDIRNYYRGHADNDEVRWTRRPSFIQRSKTGVPVTLEEYFQLPFAEWMKVIHRIVIPSIWILIMLYGAFWFYVHR